MFLSQQQQKEYITEYKQTQNSNVLNYILNSNSSIIKKIARSFFKKNSNLSFDDLISAGNEGLLHAIRKYDASKNDAFLPYAKLWIKAKMQEYVKDNCSSVTITGRNGRKLFSNYFKYINELEDSGEIITIDTISEKSKISKNEIVDFSNALYATCSINHDFENNEEEKICSASDSIEKQYEKKEAYDIFNLEINKFVSDLSNKEKIIWFNRCYNTDPVSLYETSKQIDLSNKETSLLEKKIMRKFKKIILSSDNKDIYHGIIED